VHYRLYVLTNKGNAKTSEEAREYVYNQLSNDDSFAGEGGRFGSPIADWFVVGGRWSGHLTNLLLDQKKLEAFYKECEENKLFWTNGTDMKEVDQRKKVHKLFLTYFPKFKGMLPHYRDSYEHQGFEDDAQIITKELWKAIEKEYKSSEEHGGTIPLEPDASDDGIVDLEFDTVSKADVVGKKWIVIVDYHN
jgi:hypothetical protein